MNTVQTVCMLYFLQLKIRLFIIYNILNTKYLKSVTALLNMTQIWKKMIKWMCVQVDLRPPHP